MAVCVLSTAMALAYAFKNGLGNAPDEPAHAAYVLALARDARLPVWNRPKQPDSYEFFQPPLYYAAASALYRSLAFLPLRGRLLALRVFSCLLHGTALLLIGGLASKIGKAPGSSLAPMILVAALPMFLFLGSSISNDAAADLAGAALLCWAATRESPPALSDWAVFGALGGAALLCKLTTAPLAAAGALRLALMEKDKGRAVKRLALAAALCAVMAGWFYWRNLSLYGDATGVGLIGREDTSRYGYARLGLWLWLFFQSFWGRFGWMTRPMPLWTYGILLALCAASALGWLFHAKALWRRPARPFLLAALVLTLASAFNFGFFRSFQPQGRYAFPALAAWAVLLWDGLGAWLEALPPRLVRFVYGALALAAGAVQLAAWRSL